VPSEEEEEERKKGKRRSVCFYQDISMQQPGCS
jgi:hypothetical protein